MRKNKKQQSAKDAKVIADYLKKTGFGSLGEAIAFYSGNAAPIRSEGMNYLSPTRKKRKHAQPNR